MVSAVKVRVVHRPQLTEGPWRNEFQRRARRVRRGAAATARPAWQAGGRRRIGPKHESAKRQFAFVFQADTDGTSLRDSCRSRASLCGLCALCVVRRQ